jgi:hypothetical protein
MSSTFHARSPLGAGIPRELEVGEGAFAVEIVDQADDLAAMDREDGRPVSPDLLVSPRIQRSREQFGLGRGPANSAPAEERWPEPGS